MNWVAVLVAVNIALTAGWFVALRLNNELIRELEKALARRKKDTAQTPAEDCGRPSLTTCHQLNFHDIVRALKACRSAPQNWYIDPKYASISVDRSNLTGEPMITVFYKQPVTSNEELARLQEEYTERVRL